GPVESALLAVKPVGACTKAGEPKRLGQQRRLALGLGGERPGALHADDRVFGRDLGMVGSQRRLAVAGDHQLEGQPRAVVEPDRTLAALSVVAPRSPPPGPE